MNIKLLKAFITVVNTGSFSKAAERLFLSQPALSQNIKQLECYFSIDLIKRTPHTFSLTEAGKTLYQHASVLTAAAEMMEEAMKPFSSSFNSTLLVGATNVIGGYAVPCSIFLFKRKHPDAMINLKVGNRRQILDYLRSDTIDIAIVEGDQPDGNVRTAKIHVEEMVIIAPNNQRWNTCKALSLHQFLSLPLIMREDGSATRWAVESTLQQAGIDPRELNIVMELHSVDSIKAAVEAGHGISVLPRVAVKKELYSKALCSLQVDTLSFLQPIYLAYKNKMQPKIAAGFIKLMKSSANGFC